MSPVKVSVVMTTYQLKHTIGAALDSVLAQQCHIHEIIVVDDGSTDWTLGALHKYMPYIRYVYQRNQGQGAALNLALSMVDPSTELVMFLDADDLWFPSKAYLQVQHYLDFPEAGEYVLNGESFTDSVVGWEPAQLFFQNTMDTLDGHKHGLFYCYPMMATMNMVCTLSQCAVPKRMLDLLGPNPFDTRFRMTVDWMFHLKVTRTHPILFCDEQLVRWRRSPQSVSLWTEANKVEQQELCMREFVMMYETERDHGPAQYRQDFDTLAGFYRQSTLLTENQPS